MFKITCIINLDNIIFCHSNSVGIDTGLYHISHNICLNKFILRKLDYGGGYLQFGTSFSLNFVDYLVIYSDYELLHAEKIRREVLQNIVLKPSKMVLPKTLHFIIILLILFAPGLKAPQTSPLFV